MTDPSVAAWSAKLYDTGTLLGARNRRRAAERLAELGTPEAVRALAEAYVAASDDRVVVIAERTLIRLTDQGAIDAVCDVLLAKDSDRLAALVTIAGYAHSDRTRQALLLFLLGEFERYAELDFDGGMLAAAHALADESLRARLAEQARTAGRVDWVRAITGASRAFRAGALSDPEWRAAVETLTAASRWEDLWRLAREAPPLWGARMLRVLGRRRWHPRNDAEREGLDGLVELARACSDEPAGDPIPGRPTEMGGGWSPVSRLAVTPDGALLAGAGTERTRVWQVPAGDLASIAAIDPVMGLCVALTSEGGLLANGDEEGRVWLRRLPSSELAGVLKGHKRAVRDVAVTPDGSLLASGSDDCTVRLWHLPSGEPAGVLAGHESPVWDVAITPDGTLLASGSLDGTVRLWRLPSGEPAGVLTHPARSAGELLITPDSRLLIAAGESRAVQLWRLPAGERVGSLAHEDEYTGQLAVTPDGTLLASADQDLVRLWHLPSGEPAGVLRGPEGWGSSCLAVSPDGRWLACGNVGGTVRLWRLPSGTPGGTLDGDGTTINDIVFMPDGSSLAIASSGSVYLWHLWHAALRVAVRTPVGALQAADVVPPAEVVLDDEERAWAALVAGLVRWRQRHDIELDHAAAEPGLAADIEVE